MDNDEFRKAWIERAHVVGRAQARYLWLLLVSGVFFLALHGRVQIGAAQTLTVPFIQLELTAIPVWAAGPSVLLYLLLAMSGSLRAYRTVTEALDIAGYGKGEAYDTNPNALDFAAYTTAKSWLWLRQVLLLKYPLILSLFYLEAAWLLSELWSTSTPVPFRPLFVVVAAVLFVPATWRLLDYWTRNIGRAWKLRVRSKPPSESDGAKDPPTPTAEADGDTWIRFRYADAFPQSGPLENWVASLAVVANDLVLTNNQIIDLFEKEGRDSPEALYFFWLTSAHFREAAKLLGSTLAIPEVQEFVEGLPPEAKNLLAEVRVSFDPWEGSFVQRVAKPLRDSFFHYPLPDEDIWENVWAKLHGKEGGLRRRGPEVRQARFVFADDVRASLLGRHLGETDDQLSESLGYLADMIGKLAVFAQHALNAHLGPLAPGRLIQGKPGSPTNPNNS